MTIALEISDATMAAIAERVAQILTPERAPAPAPVSPYMTIPEAAEYLRCSRQRVDDLLSARRLTRVKEGRRTLVRRDEIEAHLGRAPARGSNAPRMCRGYE
jgi:excisionase family DNA binding protein